MSYEVKRDEDEPDMLNIINNAENHAPFLLMQVYEPEATDLALMLLNAVGRP